MPNNSTETEVTTSTHTAIKITVGVVMLAALTAGAAVVHGMAILSSSKSVKTTKIVDTKTTPTEEAIDTTEYPIFNESEFSNEDYTAAVAELEAAPLTTGDVSVEITSPLEGDIYDGTGFIEADLVDPNNKVSGVRFNYYNDAYGYFSFLGKVNSPPYRKQPLLRYYPSGTYRYVVTAIGHDASILATDEIWVTIAHSCYYALPNFNFALDEGEKISVQAGNSFTLNGTLTNNHRGQCSDTFSLQQTAPTGWTYEVASPARSNGTKTMWWVDDVFERTSVDVKITVKVPRDATRGEQEYGLKATWAISGFEDADTVIVDVLGKGEIVEPEPDVIELP